MCVLSSLSHRNLLQFDQTLYSALAPVHIAVGYALQRAPRKSIVSHSTALYHAVPKYSALLLAHVLMNLEQRSWLLCKLSNVKAAALLLLFLLLMLLLLLLRVGWIFIFGQVAWMVTLKSSAFNGVVYQVVMLVAL